MSELKVLSARAPQMALDQIFANFTRHARHGVTPSYGTVGAIVARFKAGEKADLLVLSETALAAMDGIVTSPTAIARAGLAVAIRSGHSAPDISTPEAFTAALLTARAISYSDPAGGGSAAAYFAGLLERLGVAEAVNAKAKLGRNGHHVAELAASGEVDLGISFLSELVAIKGVSIVGPLPAALQNYTIYAAAVPTASTAHEMAVELIGWLTRPAARHHWLTAGLEPLGEAEG